MVDWRAMAREPVAVDYMGVGGAPSSISGGHEERTQTRSPGKELPFWQDFSQRRIIPEGLSSVLIRRENRQMAI